MAIPKKIAERIKLGIRRFTKVLEAAKISDRSEQDTVTIVTDMLEGIFGYDKYEEITGEYAIRGTFCDIAVKVEGKTRYLIEVKAIGKELKESHLRQATTYAAKEGIEWVILTNGARWMIHRMFFEQPIRHENVVNIDFLNPDKEIAERIFMLSRETIGKQAISDYYEQRQVLSRHMVASVLLSEPILAAIRRELRRAAPNVKIEQSDVESVLRLDVIKRDIFEGDELKAANRRINRASDKALRKSVKKLGDTKASGEMLPTTVTNTIPVSSAGKGAVPQTGGTASVAN
ncbi:MAG TPA: type I restriction enzyme HsdR N-terminal domain-containing protein [Phycisphaerae bacterium]|nr:type I restriction enzyme HsdR N-terminal domain-containing protein [Phycisphaerae bacterium]